MSSDYAIEISHVTKRYTLSGGSLKGAFMDYVRGRKQAEKVALDDVSFTVGHGETLGLIGSNGAGKSTLLSVITGTVFPTSGYVRTNGIVSSLLELGAGFHPDLTGRENVYLYGSIMGIPKAEMRKRFDDVVDFAGIGPYIDEPVRTYSSGMYVRLGFSVAVQVNPDILLIDEVLAVGDADFQKRCLDKMDEFRKQGKTLLIISHDLNTIRAISDRIAFLDHGHVMGIGEPDEQVLKYRTALLKERSSMHAHEWGTKEALLTKVRLVDENGNERLKIGGDRLVRVEISYESSKRIEKPTFGFSIADADNRTIFGYNTELVGYDIPFIEGKGKVLMELDTSTLCAGSYIMSFSLHSRDHQTNYHRLEQALPVFLEKVREFDGLAQFPVSFRQLPK